MGISNTKKFFGPPGTGKTTKLLNLVEKHLEEGVQPDRVAFISYSVKAANEAKTRAQIKLGLGMDEMPYFCTSHAFCKRAMNIGRVMIGADIKDFLEKYSFTLTKNYLMTSRGSIASLQDDPYFKIIENAKINCRTVEEERLQTPLNERDGVNPTILMAIAEAWEIFRKDTLPEIHSFADMIEVFIEKGKTPPLDVLVVDEAQDLAELNWRLVEKLARDIPTIYIAGDDDQAIYEWNGAKPERFVSFSGESVVLDQSFRIPKKVHTLAEKISKRIKNRQEKDYEPRDKEGLVERVSHTDMLPIDKGQWLILASCDYMLQDSSKGYGIRHDLIKKGIPFSHNHYRYIPLKMIAAVDVWNKLTKSTESVLTMSELADLYNYLGKTEIKRGFITKVINDPNKAQKITRQEAIDNYGLMEECLGKEWKDVFTRTIDVARRSFIEKAIANGEDLYSEPRVAISTIHQAKGGEAENVAVLLDLSPAQKNHSMLHPDGLHRQFYVAVTRALDSLYLVQSRNDKYRYNI